MKIRFSSFDMVTKHVNVVFFVIVLIGLGLRLNAVLHQSFWVDETSIFTVSRGNTVVQLLFMLHFDKNHPQLYYLFLHYWQQISTNIIFLRLPSLLAYLLSTTFLFRIGRKMGGVHAGLLTLIFFAVNPFFVNLGFQQKMYAFEMCFMFGSLYYLLRLLEDSKKKEYVNKFIAYSVLGFFTDYSFVWYWLSIFVAIEVVFSFLGEKKQTGLRQIARYYLVSSSIMAPQLILLVSGIKEALKNEAYLEIPDINGVQYVVAQFIGLSRYFYCYPFICLLVVLITLSCIWILFKKKNVYLLFSTLFCLTAFYVVLLVSYSISQDHPIFLARNLLVASFFFLLMIPQMLVSFPNLVFRIIIWIVYGLLIFSMTITSIQLRDEFEGTERFGEIYNIAKRVNKPVTILLVSDGDFRLSSLRDYYFKGYYDRGVSVNYSELIIHKSNLLNWNLSSKTRDSLSRVLILLEDDVLTQDELIATKAIYSKLCVNPITCYGPFSLY